ncbi:MAG: hypothetical protein JJ863_20985 [Deltaproteobacteria bacterium]|nr:hypothetical protein [Deltaproteobacteria bacterium]
MSRFLFLALCVACAAPTPRPAPVPPPIAARPAEPEATATDRPLTPAERDVMASLQAAAVEVRRLPFLHPVVTRVRNAASITQRLSEQMEEDDLAQASEIYKALGLLPADTDIRDLLEGVLGEQVVGYYDPDQGEMVIRDDVMATLLRGGPAAEEPEGILVHELVHALQDQHHDLKALYEQDRNNDASGALRSLVEGDATLAMVALGARAGDVQRLSQQIAGNVPTLEEMMVDTAMPQGGMTLSQAPAIVRATLVVPYLAGLGFCTYWASKGGWAAVERQFEDLPLSTEQVLHPEKSASRERPVEITIPSLDDQLGPEGLGTEMIDEDTLGELELAVYFGQGRTSGVHADAAAGWSGDRLRVYRGGPMGAAVVWLTLWDDEDEALEAEAAARHVGQEITGGHVQREGRAVVILRNVPRARQRPTTAALFRAAREAIDLHEAGPPPPPTAP